VIEAETCCHLVTLNKINIHNTSCVLKNEQVPFSNIPPSFPLLSANDACKGCIVGRKVQWRMQFVWKNFVAAILMT